MCCCYNCLIPNFGALHETIGIKQTYDTQPLVPQSSFLPEVIFVVISYTVCNDGKLLGVCLSKKTWDYIIDVLSDHDSRAFLSLSTKT